MDSTFTQWQTNTSLPIQRQRIKTAGIAFLEEFFRNHQRPPSLPEAHELLARIQAIPGCEGYNIDKLFLWFRRNKHGRMHLMDPDFPSLSRESIQHLEVLTRSDHESSEELLQSLAQLLKAKVDDIKAWLKHKQLSVPEAKPTQMPTLSTSLRPSFKDESCDAPVSPCQDALPLELHKPKEVDTNLLLGAISSAVQPVVVKHPSNAAEFEQMFAPYEQKMQQILANLL